MAPGRRRGTRRSEPRCRGRPGSAAASSALSPGYACPGDGAEHPAHPTRDLTLDHVLALIDGGAPFDPANTRVLCRSRNSANGVRLVNARRAGPGVPTRGFRPPGRPRLPIVCTRPSFANYPGRRLGARKRSPTGATGRWSGAMTASVASARLTGERPRVGVAAPDRRVVAAALCGWRPAQGQGWRPITGHERRSAVAASRDRAAIPSR